MRQHRRSSVRGIGPRLARGIQIGPRIRVGGTLGKIGEGIKKILPSPGGIIGAATGIPGAAIAGSLLGGANPATDAAKGAAVALPIAGLTHNAPTPSTGTIPVASGDGGWIDPDTGESVPEGTPGAIPADSGGGGGGSAGGSVATGGSGIDWGKALAAVGGDVGALIKKYGATALEGLNIYQSAQRQAQADQYAKDALARSTSGYDAKSGLRSSGISGLMDPSAGVPNLSSLQSLAGAKSGNPFARGGALPVAAPAGPPGRPISAGPVNNTPMPGLSPGQQLTLPPQGTLKGVLDGTQGTLPVAVPGANLPPGAGALATGTVKPRTLPFAAPTDRTDGTQDTSLPPRIMS